MTKKFCVSFEKGESIKGSLVDFGSKAYTCVSLLNLFHLILSLKFMLHIGQSSQCKPFAYVSNSFSFGKDAICILNYYLKNILISFFIN